MVKKLILFALTLLIAGCFDRQEVSITKPIDLNRYAGRWYEIASFPTHFHQGCHCTTAEYTPIDRYLKVKNSCYILVKNKEHQRSITGKAFPVEGTLNSHLKVFFYWPLKADYWIVFISDDYRYAAVSVPSKKYLWIFARTPQIDLQVYNNILKKLQDLGFKVNELVLDPLCKIS